MLSDNHLSMFLIVYKIDPFFEASLSLNIVKACEIIGENPLPLTHKPSIIPLVGLVVVPEGSDLLSKYLIQLLEFHGLRILLLPRILLPLFECLLMPMLLSFP